jgi:hypothetical protein
LKVTLQIEMDGGIKLPVSAEVATLADVKKLGSKLAALPAGANKLVPGIAEWKVTKIGFAKEKADGA